ncbi:hypothetical protein RSOL_424610 [Rhizoctonia solani AG-3 Rhs1AP]|uniref:Uncharacterized protein n=2 Tax=Rhizoctonia solani AG-3 TaxID=1086053 RepID=A0A074SLK7_9AGAM|nr:hypothetical protein RSOL_424610 [Rhizoctonia solani AG-3 Rhs1AP]KEP50962.1 hypothetical protein V565_070090 [Rhizoctonia solani 123E]
MLGRPTAAPTLSRTSSPDHSYTRMVLTTTANSSGLTVCPPGTSTNSLTARFSMCMHSKTQPVLKTLCIALSTPAVTTLPILITAMRLKVRLSTCGKGIAPGQSNSNGSLKRFNFVKIRRVKFCLNLLL